jgi:tetratricopeptide (TPR) repeat protein
LSFFCCGQNKKDKLACSEFNMRGVEGLQTFKNSRDSSALLKSLYFFDKAIECDPTNAINYQNKLIVLNQLSRLREALKVIDKVYELSDGKDVKLLVSKGIIYERLTQLDSSSLWYNKAFQKYSEQLERHTPDSIRIIGDRLYLTAIMEGKDSAMEKLKPYLSKYPNDSTLKLYEDLLQQFDRKVIIPVGR